MKITKDNLDLIQLGVWLRNPEDRVVQIRHGYIELYRQFVTDGIAYELVNVTVEPVPEPEKPLEQVVWHRVLKVDRDGRLVLGSFGYPTKVSAMHNAPRNCVGLKRIILREGEYDE